MLGHATSITVLTWLKGERKQKMSRTLWHWRLFCIHCGYNIHAAGNQSDMFLSMCGVGDCCKSCGATVEKTRMVPEEGKPFVNRLVRWISESVWYKPKTWDTGHWEAKDGKEIPVRC